MLISKYGDMEEDNWPVLEQLEFSVNLLPDSWLGDEVVLDLTTEVITSLNGQQNLQIVNLALLICFLQGS